MLSLPNCLLKPEIAIGIYGNTDYINDIHVAFQLLLSSKINLIPINDNTTTASSLMKHNTNSNDITKLNTNDNDNANDKGLLSHRFIKRLQMSPCIIIIPFELAKEQPIQGRTETSIYNEYCETIKQIKSSYNDLGIIALIIISNNSYSSNFLSSLINASCFNGLIDKRNILFIQLTELEDESKFNAKLIKTDVLKYISEAYSNMRRCYEDKRRAIIVFSSALSQRKNIKLLIKLAIIGVFNRLDKSNTNNYFIEAYQAIISNQDQVMKDKEKEKSIDNDKCIVYWEKRNIADWVLVNMMHYHQSTLDIKIKIDIIMKHLQLFNYDNYFNKKDNDMTIMDMTANTNLRLTALSNYWTITVYDYFNSLFSDNSESNPLLSFSFIYIVYRLINFIKVNNDALIAPSEEILDISKAIKEESAYIEKLPIYYYTPNDNTLKVECSNDIIIMLLYKHAIEYTILNEKKLGLYLQKLINKQLASNKQWEKCSTNLNMILLFTEAIDSKDKEYLYQSFIDKNSIKAFPLVYMTLLKKYTAFLYSHYKEPNIKWHQVMTNLIKLSELRQLTSEESTQLENGFINQIKANTPQIYQINANNCLIKPVYTFDNYKPSVCDLIEFTLRIELALCDDSIALGIKGILLQFNKVTRSKKISYEDDDCPLLSKSNPLVIKLNLLVQASDSNLYLTMIQLETQSGMIFLITLSQDVNKCLKTISEDNIKEHIEVLPMDNKVIVGVYEYHYYSFNIALKNPKLQIEDIQSSFSLLGNGNTINNKKIPSNIFIRFNKDNEMITSSNQLKINYNKSLLSSSSDVHTNISTIDFLLQLMTKSYEEYFLLDYEIQIKLSHIDSSNDYILYEQNGQIHIEVKDPFEFIHEYTSLYYFKQEDEVFFPVNQRITNDMIVQSCLNDSIVFKELSIIPSDANVVKVNMIGNKTMLFKESLYPLSEYVIPIQFESNAEREEFPQGEMIWSTKELMAYAPNLVNKTSFYLPIVAIKQFGVNVQSEYLMDEGLYRIRLSNIEEMPFIVNFSIEDIDEDKDKDYILIGKIVFKTILLPNTHIDIELYIIQLLMTQSNLPKIKLRVFSLDRKKQNEELYTIYYEYNNHI